MRYDEPVGATPLPVQAWSFVAACAIAGALAVPVDAVASPVSSLVAGLVGEQFALPEAVETLRAIRRRAHEEEVVVVSAADPLNLVGVLLPGGRIAPAAREVIAFRDGAPVESGELGEVLSRLGRRAPAVG